jgi:hypothetical protein
MKKLSVATVLLFLIYPGLTFGSMGQSSFEFMLLGAGSRASAMGEAFTAVSGDVGAPFFNPASAGVMDRREVSFAHIAYFEDVTIEQFSIISKAGRFGLGGSMNIGRIADIERRGQTPSGDPLGFFDEHHFTAAFFWAVPATERFSVGNSVKIAYEKLDLEDATAFAVDFGGYYSVTPGITIGASLRNLGTQPKFVDKSFDLPREIRLGAAYRTGPDLSGITVSADYIKPEWGDKSSKFNLGAEYNHQNLAYLRAGGNFGYDSRSVSFGGGLVYQRFYFDYAYVPFKNNLGNTHRFTLRVGL